MKMSNVILKPILSEKAYKLMEQGLYTFLVDKKASKKSIAQIVSKHYSVAVEKVNVARIQSKTKRVGRTRKTTNVGGGKKATVWVKKGQSIASLLPKSQVKKSKSKKDKGEQSMKEKDAEQVSVEGKEG
jgi:large subunit ribosomal protein L23